MKNKQSKLATIILLFFVLFSCKDEEVEPLGNYENGIFVINEGNFSNSNSSVSFINKSLGILTQQVFDKVNNDELGDVLQSGYHYDGKIYLVVNNSNKVEVVNAYTFEREFTIDNLQLPRYFIVDNGIGYLTEWVSFSERGRVLAINPTDGTLLDTISVGKGAENLLLYNNKLYVTNSFDTTVSVIDINENNTTTTLTLGESPKDIQKDLNENLWVMCKGGYDDNFMPENNGALYKINTMNQEVELMKQFDVNVSGNLVINNEKDKLFFYIDKNIFSFDVTNNQLTEHFSIDEAIDLYGIDIDVTTNNLYLLDNKGFTTSGGVYIYDKNFQLTNTYDVGIGPNAVIFNY